MTEKDLKKLSRTDLLEMLIDQTTALEDTKRELDKAKEALKSRKIAIDNAGSIAEAALRLNGIFEAAQISCEQYIDNIRDLNQRQQSVCDELEAESRKKADELLSSTQAECEKLKSETQAMCDDMVSKAKAESQAYWDEVSQKLEVYYNEHAGLRELLAVISHKREQN